MYQSSGQSFCRIVGDISDAIDRAKPCSQGFAGSGIEPEDG